MCAESARCSRDTRYNAVMVRAIHSCIVLDVAPGRGSAAFVEWGEGGMKTVESHALIALESHGKEGAAAAVARKLDEAMARILESAHNVRHVLYLLHPPFVTVETVIAEANFEGETVVTPEILQEMARESLSAASIVDTKRLFDAGVTRTWLNGYPTREPSGKKALTVSVASVISNCDEELRTSIEAWAQRALPSADVFGRAFPRALLRVRDGRPGTSDSYLAIDMQLEDTHILTVHDGILTDQRSIPYGARTLLKKVSGKHSPEELLSLIRLLGREACEAEACREIEGALALAEPELVKAFGEALGGMATTRRLPNELVLLTHRDLAAWLGQAFSRIDFSQFTLTTLPFQVKIPVKEEREESADASLAISELFAYDELTAGS